ncbi:MAG: hypothetical protein ABSE16_21380, partial [Verrucomicrobiota bacterium]
MTDQNQPLAFRLGLGLLKRGGQSKKHAVHERLAVAEPPIRPVIPAGPKMPLQEHKHIPRYLDVPSGADEGDLPGNFDEPAGQAVFETNLYSEKVHADRGREFCFQGQPQFEQVRDMREDFFFLGFIVRVHLAQINAVLAREFGGHCQCVLDFAWRAAAFHAEEFFDFFNDGGSGHFIMGRRGNAALPGFGRALLGGGDGAGDGG